MFKLKAYNESDEVISVLELPGDEASYRLIKEEKQSFTSTLSVFYKTMDLEEKTNVYRYQKTIRDLTSNIEYFVCSITLDDGVEHEMFNSKLMSMSWQKTIEVIDEYVDYTILTKVESAPSKFANSVQIILKFTEDE